MCMCVCVCVRACHFPSRRPHAHPACWKMERKVVVYLCTFYGGIKPYEAQLLLPSLLVAKRRVQVNGEGMCGVVMPVCVCVCVCDG